MLSVVMLSVMAPAEELCKKIFALQATKVRKVRMHGSSIEV
jgi:hypothetical protein